MWKLTRSYGRKKLQSRFMSVLNGVSDDLLVSTSMGHQIGGRSHAELVNSLVKCGVIRNEKIATAFHQIDRKLFARENSDPYSAYENRPLPLGFKATISTPQQHAQVIELLADYLTPGKTALDLGCGSGYLVAIMAKLVGVEGAVHGIDLVPDLLKQAGVNLEKVDPTCLKNGNVILSNDILQANAMFDCIHVGFAVPNKEMMLHFSNFLNPGGCLLIPVGQAKAEQVLMKVTKDENNKCHESQVMSVLCQGVLSEIPKEDVVMSRSARRKFLQNELSTWRKDFEKKHGRSPSRDDMFADANVKSQFLEFSSLR